MKVSVTRKSVKFFPDSSRVVARYFMSGEGRTRELVSRILAMNNQEVNHTLEQIYREFARRHRNLSYIFYKHCENIRSIIEEMQVNYEELSEERKKLIGSYLTMEYSIESSAFFNPSIIEDFDQSSLEKGEKRVVISFRATGEGHVSSVVFRRGILDKDNNLRMMRIGDNIEKAEVSHKMMFNKKRIISKLADMHTLDIYSSFLCDMPEVFEYSMFRDILNKELEDPNISKEKKEAYKEVLWLMDSFYDIQFKHDSDISERVIFPISDAESRGIEDARFVRFVNDDNSESVMGTYTAYNGHAILSKLITTEDFYTFRIMPLHGKDSQSKGMALFPKKVKGKYAMLCRVDGVNNYLMYSDRINEWESPKIIQRPEYPWEYTQIGNCGSPLWTQEGWLVITHGVGAMRRYCIGVALFDLDDPSKEIGRLSEPLLTPLEDEREGYVPNVVYSCGSIIHNNSLILPYAVSDYSSTYAVVDMVELMVALKNSKK
ncbi:MAG TPA: glycoside hydrolase family 130 protein [Flavobacterium sp.]|uniref:glycoside hydrolase family 130 protein n=1 Tax=Flavobacterium sp. TaxID=239 RepID=UPI002DBC17EC|nr:glycoside hydrolase family 130 protein [Flavobacterium sp.]HEU4788408.1 glycoside hydrolase family 130 protein [Flavobacterium sp.]